ncbi:CobD/CbiB family cobalamin biosynthesis protein [Halorubrum sp. DTA46]|uniref:CobD/CbiB family cobalamin biosynthesis protein n=1 Tax=Halorubrum sp. DTA46 TaxID=3402162 RepID=UPI003AADE410
MLAAAASPGTLAPPVLDAVALTLPALAAVGIAVALDLAIAEPPTRIHPVAWFGSIVGRTDRPWARPRLVGVAVAGVLPIAAAALAGGLVAVAAGIGSLFAALVAGVALFSTVSLRMLLDETARVVELTQTSPDAARESIRALVGRDTADLSPAALRSAAVESAAENLADGFVAPLGGFLVGATVGLGLAVGGAEAGVPADAGAALSLGVAGAVWVKAVNTLDSMLGYRTKPVGWASARLDDGVMFLPARATAVCLAVAAGSLGALRAAGRWARVPASPNSGWPMATAAAALDVRLEKPRAYVLAPDAAPPTVADAERAVRLVGVAGGVAVAGAAGWLVTLAGVIAWA